MKIFTILEDVRVYSFIVYSIAYFLLKMKTFTAVVARQYLNCCFL